MSMRRSLMTVALVSLLAIPMASIAGAHQHGPRAGQGPHGHGGGPAEGMGPGMMRQGAMGPGMMGPGMMGQGMMPMMRGMMGGQHGMHALALRGDRAFTAEEVRRVIDGRLAMRGLSRLKVGKVAEKGDDAFVVEILTLDDSLAVSLTVDRASGRVTAME